MAPQFPDFRKVRGRIRRTLGYGSRQPHSINLPLSELVVDYFNKQSPFDYMRPETSASISGCGYADPCTLVVAMVYLDRLRVKNKKWFESSDPTDLYLPALVIASKFLHDADTYDRASTADWAEAMNISSQHLSQLEWEFVQKMNWNVMVGQVEFDRWLSFFEYWVANDFVVKNNFCTYNEVVQLSSSFPLLPTIQCLASFFGLMIMVYAFSFVSLFVVPCTLTNLGLRIAENSTGKSISPVILPLSVPDVPHQIPSPLEAELKNYVNSRLLQIGNISSAVFGYRRHLNSSDCEGSPELLSCDTCMREHFSLRHCLHQGCHIPDFSIYSFI